MLRVYSRRSKDLLSRVVCAREFCVAQMIGGGKAIQSPTKFGIEGVKVRPGPRGIKGPERSLGEE